MDTQVPEGILENVITRICFRSGAGGLTKLMKLVYLVDVYYARMCGHDLTKAGFIRWEFGAFAQNVLSAIDSLVEKGVLEKKRMRTAYGHIAKINEPALPCTTTRLSPTARAAVDAVLEDWGNAKTQEVVAYSKRILPFIGTEFGQPIDFKRVDFLGVYAKAKGISTSEAATLSLINNKELVEAVIDGDKDARAGRFVPREEVYKQIKR